MSEVRQRLFQRPVVKRNNTRKGETDEESISSFARLHSQVGNRGVQRMLEATSGGRVLQRNHVSGLMMKKTKASKGEGKTKERKETFGEWLELGPGRKLLRKARNVLIKSAAHAPFSKEPLQLIKKVRMNGEWVRSDLIYSETPLEDVGFSVGPLPLTGWLWATPKNVYKKCKEAAIAYYGKAKEEPKYPSWVNKGAKDFISDFVKFESLKGPHAKKCGRQLVWVNRERGGVEAEIQTYFPSPAKLTKKIKEKEPKIKKRKLELIILTHQKWNTDMFKYVLAERLRPSAARAKMADIDREVIKTMIQFVACSGIGP